MCGIVGELNLTEEAPVEREVLLSMLSAIQHRGPDGFGIYRDAWAGMGNARLSIIDISGGNQPITNEDGSLWIVYNGEIFNYKELRVELEKRGHHFSTNSDTEVVLHLYEEYGSGCLKFLNGQFAIALWDKKARKLFLARDRVGIRPVFYTIAGNKFIWASEVKAILAHPGVKAEIDIKALTDVFTFWSPQSPSTIFQGIYELPPAYFLEVQNGQVQIKRYWALDFSDELVEADEQQILDEFESLLVDATLIRLRADVPVGAYLSGGLDSSLTAAMIHGYTTNRLDTFSISFSDRHFDESYYQSLMAEHLGTEHHEVFCKYSDIADVFPEVIWHTETPILRTSPAPMFLLSKLVRQHNFKVVMTGEGADEFMGGYDIFKEMKVRRFWAKNPDSKLRPQLLFKLYPDINRMSASGAFLIGFFKRGLLDTGSPFYSHAIRWSNTARNQRFLVPSPERDQLAGRQGQDQFEIPDNFSGWSDFAKAQYWEVVTFLSPYLLSSQGDRMAMAHSVEGRYPFLDYRVIEFCNRLPARYKMPGLMEKYLLKQLGQKYLPEKIWKRLKRPYRAPIQKSFFEPQLPEYAKELLSEESLRSSNLFEPQAVQRLLAKAGSGAELSEIDDMALVGILSTQLVDQLFVRGNKPEAVSSPALLNDFAF